MEYAPAANIDGSRHTAVGFDALQNCIAPPDFAGNTAIGTRALFSDTTGNFNTAIGDAALKLNTTGGVNTAIGLDALVFNATGDRTPPPAVTRSLTTHREQNTATVLVLWQTATGVTPPCLVTRRR